MKMKRNKRYFDYDFHSQMVGWSYSPKHYKRPLYSLKQFFKEVKWAWQRVVRGYDDRMTWDLHEWALQHLIAGLRELIANNEYGSICKRDEQGNRIGDWLSVEQTNNIFRTILKHLLLSDEDFYQSYMYGDKWYEVKNKPFDPSPLEVHKECHKHLMEGLELLKRYYYDLWL